MDILPCIHDKCCRDPCDSHRAPDPHEYRIDFSVGDDVRRLRVPEGRDVFQPVRFFRQVGDNIQEVQECRNSQSNADPASAQGRGDAEADCGDLDLKQEIGCVEQEEFGHLKLLTDGIDDCHGCKDAHCVQDQDLDQYTEQLVKDDPCSADRVGEQEFGSPVLFLIRQSGDTDVRGEECSADPKDVPAFQPVEAHQFSHVQAVHAESLGESAHGGENGV